MSRFSASSFRTVGSAATGQNLFSIWNGSDKPISIKKLVGQADCSAALATFAAVLRACLVSTKPTGGTVLSKNSFGGATSDAGVEVLGATASEGGALTAITSTPTAGIWSSFITRIHTAVGQIIPTDTPLLPELSDEHPYELKPNTGLLVNILAAATTSNPATNHYLINALWDE